MYNQNSRLTVFMIVLMQPMAAPISFHTKINIESPFYLNENKYNYVPIVTIKEKVLVIKTPYFGRSFQNKQLVSDLLINKIAQTALLAIVAMLFATILGILMGVLASLNYNTILDRFLVSFSVLGVSVPSYFSALLLALFLGYYFADYTGLNLTGSLIAISDEGEYYFEWKNIILPAIALGIRPIAIVTQLTRNAMLDVIRSDYVRTAKAKGLSSFQVIFKHTLRNALNPVITSVSDWFATLLAGAFFVEWIFDYKGLGHTTVSALLNFDFPVVMGAILFIAFVFVILSIVVDIFYSLVDPRVRLE